MIDAVEKLSYESVLCATGRVIKRPPGQENKNMKTGAIEIQVSSLEILNESLAQLPFSIRNHNIAKESLQMQYRYLSLRFPSMQRNLRLRSRITHKMREYLIDHCGFVDVETPTLFRRTPGVKIALLFFKNSFKVLCQRFLNYSGSSRICRAYATSWKILFPGPESSAI